MSDLVRNSKDRFSRNEAQIVFSFSDKMLQGDPIKWDVAVKTIMSVFEDAFKMIKNINYKNGR